MLYRGINKADDAKCGGRILPRGSAIEVTPKVDGKWKVDGRFKCGTCASNTARAHHIEPGLYGGCGISTSHSEEMAIYFATHKYTREGYVYVIDETLLAAANVDAHEFPDPLYRSEKEVTLIEKSGGALPEQVIVDKYAVSMEGRKIQQE